MSLTECHSARATRARTRARKMSLAESSGQSSHGAFPVIIECSSSEDVFGHIASFLQLEEIAVLMPTCQVLRQTCLRLAEWEKAEAQLHRMNRFDCCPYCELPWRSRGVHVKECKEYYGHRDYKWLKANDPRLAQGYVKKTAYARFGLLYRFHTSCTQNLLSTFQLGGDFNSLENQPNFFEVYAEGWGLAMHDLSYFSPRRFHLLNDIVSMSIACSDLGCDAGPKWYRRILQGAYDRGDQPWDFDAFFDDECDDWLEWLYDMAIEHQVEFGSRKHFKVLARSLKCPAERYRDGLGKLGIRLLHKVSPMRMLKDTMNGILDRCDAGEDEDLDFFSSDDEVDSSSESDDESTSSDDEVDSDDEFTSTSSSDFDSSDGEEPSDEELVEESTGAV